MPIAGTWLKRGVSYIYVLEHAKEINVRNSKTVTCTLLAGTLLISSAVFSKLPPPTPEEQSAATQKKAQEAAQLEKEKAQLERAQNRVAERYRKAHGGHAAGRTSDQNMPKTASELPGGTGPTPQRQQSGEAHSAPAK